MKVFEILGKRVLTSSGKGGYVLAVLESGGEFTGIRCADENEREFFVAADGIKKVKSCVLCSAKKAKPCGKPVRLGAACYDRGGNFLGNLIDVTIGGGRIKTLKIGKKNYPYQGEGFGDALIITAPKILKQSVKKGENVLFFEGENLSEIKERALKEGEYVQTTLKSI